MAAAVDACIPVVVKGGRASKRLDGTFFYDTSVGQLMNNLQHMIDVESSECSVQEDYDREIAAVRALDGGVQRVNKVVMGVVVGAYLAIHHNVLEIDAAVCGEPEALWSLCMSPCSTEKERELACRVLSSACAGGRVEIVRELLERWQGGEKEIKCNRSDQERRTEWLCGVINDSGVIRSASSGGHAQVVAMLLGVDGVDANVVATCFTALYLACQNGHLNVVDILLSAPQIDANRATNDGRTPLWMACQNGHTEIVKRLLLIPGSDINRAKNDGQTPFMRASRNRHVGIVHVLTDAGAMVDSHISIRSSCSVT